MKLSGSHTPCWVFLIGLCSLSVSVLNWIRFICPALRQIKTMMKEISFHIHIMLLCIAWGASAWEVNNSAVPQSPPAANLTDIGSVLKFHVDSANIPKARRRRYISQNDMITILDYHNKVRGRVFPPASNMEYMVSIFIAKCVFCRDVTCTFSGRRKK